MLHIINYNMYICYRSTFAAATVVILAIMVTSQTTDVACNSFDLAHNFSCPFGQPIINVSGHHDNRFEDRMYCYSCRPDSKNATDCYQTGFVNELDNPVATLCRPNYYIAGVYSDHDNTREDRRFDYRCCENTYQCTRDCILTGPVNTFDGVMSYNSSHGNVIVGAFSWHDNVKE